MARKPVLNSAEGFAMPQDAYAKMTAAMMELAMRGNREEAIVMRIAKAGGITDVTKDLIRLRTYAKKQGLVRPPRPPKDNPTTPRSGARKRKRTPAKNAATGGTATGTEE